MHELATYVAVENLATSAPIRDGSLFAIITDILRADTELFKFDGRLAIRGIQLFLHVEGPHFEGDG
jgi:hypothetical protein